MQCWEFNRKHRVHSNFRDNSFNKSTMNNRQLLLTMFTMILIYASTLSLSQYVEFHRNHRNGGQKNNIDYSFRYFIDETASGVSLDHWESKQLDGVVTGGYGVKDPNGNVRTVYYEVEDDSGFKAVIRTVLPTSLHFQRLWSRQQPKTPFRHAAPVNVL